MLWPQQRLISVAGRRVQSCESLVLLVAPAHPYAPPAGWGAIGIALSLPPVLVRFRALGLHCVSLLRPVPLW